MRNQVGGIIGGLHAAPRGSRSEAAGGGVDGVEPPWNQTGGPPQIQRPTCSTTSGPTAWTLLHAYRLWIIWVRRRTGLRLVRCRVTLRIGASPVCISRRFARGALVDPINGLFANVQVD